MSATDKSVDPTAEAADSGDALARLEEALGHSFRDRGLLLAALTHRSYANEAPEAGPDYQRLEFLGDALVGATVAAILYRLFPDTREGGLTVRRAALVKEARLARAARSLGVQPLIRVGRGAEASALPARDSVLADVFEALVAAVWLDAGPDGARIITALLGAVFAEDLAEPGSTRALKPVKARLQELAQRRWKTTPRYAPVGEAADGVDVELSIGTHLRLRAHGRSRREAEIAAAEQAFARLQEETPS